VAIGDPITWNPGEPVFDQVTGEPYIDPDGAMVEVEPGLLVTRSDGTTLDGDDVANAAWFRANLFLGESLRDRSVGVPYLENVLGGTNLQLAAATVVGEVKARTPGVAGIVAVRVLGLDPQTRVMQWTATLLRKDGNETALATTTTGG
jgi:hypothetical protein